jgi:RHS repeat-associated protein
MKSIRFSLLVMMLALLGGIAFAQAPHGQVTVVLTEPLTDTGMHFQAGQNITITAGGILNWFTGTCPTCQNTPAGQSGGVCESLQGFFDPDFPCWSLIGQIGDGPLFEIGNGITMPVTQSGELYLGVNDNNYPDNTGNWQAAINQPLKMLGQTCPGNTDNAASDPTQSINDTGNGSCGHPVDVNTGNVYAEFTDYKTAGANTLAFTRYYNSQGSSTGMFGSNWSSNYDRFLQLLSPSVVLAVRPDGRQYTFTLIGSAWASDKDVDVSLVQSGSSWTLKDHDDTTETYTTTSQGNQAPLNTITARNGYRQTMAYNSTNQLASVTDSYGRRLAFAYFGLQLSTLTTPENQVFTYQYNGNQLLATVISPVDAGGYTYSFSYENGFFPAALIGITDRNGDQIDAWTYDDSGRALSSSEGNSGVNANLTMLTYNPDGTTTITNPLGVQNAYTFTTLQNVPKVTLVNRAATGTTQAATRSFSYDSNGYTSSGTDWNGNQTTYANDSHGDPTLITEAVGSPVQRTTAITYNQQFVHLPSSIATSGLTTSYTYDSSGNPLTKTLTDTSNSGGHHPSGQARTWTYTWSNFLPASVKTPNGNLTTFTYDSTGALTAITNPLSQTTHVTIHTAGGYPQTLVDPNGVATTLTYDGQMRLTSNAINTTQGLLITQYNYWFENKISSTVLPDGSTWSNSFDSALRLTKNADIYQNNIQYDLDLLGDRTQANTYDDGGTLHRQHSGTFDALGRALTDVGGAGQTTTYTYDNNGNALTVTDPLGHTTSQVFDAFNRLSRSTDANNGLTQFTYDAHDRPLTVTDPNGGQTAYVYDGFGDVLQRASPDSGSTLYSYDLDANLLQRIAATSAIANYTYDPLDRVSTTTYPSDPAENVAYIYDQTGHGFGIGRLTSLTDAVGSLSRIYDERGNTTQESRTSGSVHFNTYYGYDKASRIAKIVYPSNWQISYIRDNAGRVTTISGKPTSTTAIPPSAMTPIISNVNYEPFGPVTGFTLGNGIVDSRTYDMDYRLQNLADTGSVVVQNLSYSYDSDNNVSTIADAVNSGNSQRFGYDVLNRLNGASAGYGAYSWTYNSVGSRLSETLGLSTTNYVYGAHDNQLLTLSQNGNTIQAIGYTADGNMNSFNPGITSPGGELITALTYNQAAQLSGVMSSGDPLAQYAYDAFGQRLAKTLNGSTGALYQNDLSGRLLEETDAHGTPQANYVYLNGTPIAAISPASKKVYFLHDERLGTPQLATDRGQNTAWSATYLPFGGTSYVQGLITQNLRLPGQHFDVESSWNHNGFRDYAQPWGRYLEVDPIGLAGGINTYSYVGANPGKFTDRRGLQDDWEPPYINPDCNQAYIPGGPCVDISSASSTTNPSTLTCFDKCMISTLIGEGPGELYGETLKRGIVNNPLIKTAIRACVADSLAIAEPVGWGVLGYEVYKCANECPGQ